MGTQLQYYAIDHPLCSSNKDSSCSGSQLDDWDYFRNSKRTVVISFQNTMMDRMVQQQNIESIKNTMLMHETVFRHQVRELHRLYGVQKKLMEEMRNEIKQQNGYLVMSRPAFDLERPAQEEDLSSSAIEEDHQAAAGPRTCRSALKTSSKLGKLDHGGEDDEEEDVELTLSLGGGCIGKNKSRCRHYHHQHHHQDSSALKEIGSSSLMKSGERDHQECSGTNSSSSATSFDQQSKRPHWLFQSLNLNRTQ